MYRYLLVVILTLSGCASVQKSGSRNQEALESAKLYYEKALYSDAERIYLKLDQSNPNNYDINFRLGNIYVRTGQYPAAEIRYRKCIEIDSSEPKGWYNLSLLKIKEAIALTEEGMSKSRLKDESFEEEFILLRNGLIKAVTGI